MWAMDWSEWKEGDDYPVGVPLWRYSGKPIGRVSEVTDCCGGLMFKVDLDMSIYKKPKKEEKKKMFGSKNKEIKRLKKDLAFWKDMDDVNNKLLNTQYAVIRKDQAEIGELKETNAKLKEDLENANNRFVSANNAAQYWLKKALSAREELIRKNERSGYDYTRAIDALKIYRLQSENFQLKKENAELGGKCIEYERVLREFRLRYPDLYGLIPQLFANKTTA